MKLKYIVNDLAEVLTEYYISLRQVKVTDTKRLIMQLHVKQAIEYTFAYLYDPVNDVCSIDVWDFPMYHKYELGYDIIYDKNIATEMIYDIRKRLMSSLTRTDHTIGNDDDVINIHDVPFEGFGITKNDILHLLDLDCR
jgi:hypothetical protein